MLDAQERSAHCPVCENECLIPEGGTGRCGRYENSRGAVVERFPDRYLLSCPIKIETMPLLHFHPGARFLQLSTVGCNFDCPGCISTVIVREMNPDSRALHRLTPEQVVEKAIQHGCDGVTFLMNDPLAAFDTFIAVAKQAKAKGLKVGCASNGYFSRQAMERVIPLLDCINIGVKGLSDSGYQDCAGFKGVSPVLRNIKLFHEAGVHVEVACIHKRDNAGELLELAAILRTISPGIPLQVMRFIPLEGADPDQEPLIRDTEELCVTLRQFLDHVYVFNSPGTDMLDTVCTECGERLARRDFYGPMGARLLKVDVGGAPPVHCPVCGHEAGMTGLPTMSGFKEKHFQGGYPFTRALEIVESILIAMGAEDASETVSVWEHLLCNHKMQDLHHDIQRTDKYAELVRFFGSLVGRETAAEELATYLEEKTERVRRLCAGQKHSPRVYYAMGKPLFCIKGERFENHLVELCNGISVNRELELGGRPGMSIGRETLIRLNPEVIFISSFLSNSPDVFHQECEDKGIDVEAVRQRRIHTSPIPSSDFGSPKWVLGLMHAANAMHPEAARFDIDKEAREFHDRFYGGDFDPLGVNRSFAKPNSAWRWDVPVR
ncbi:radical SAM protein [Pseudodesulfovibrio cashew]|uniref:Radical SAM protein n=1 Tax=Pseudodesulfovibrio cashew TaxID=2678688 RepID=A0A6I6JLY9_9BACT|nr:radical SAM protein [Pseudodesulfovibrio cashew]